LLVGLLVASLTGFAQDGVPIADSSNYRELSFKIRRGTLDQTSVLREIDQRIEEVHTRTLSEPRPSSESLTRALRELQGADSLNSFFSESNVPVALVFEIRGTLVAFSAVAILSGGEGIPDVQAELRLYARPGGQWVKRAQLGDDFTGRWFSAAPIHSADSNEVWVLVWGTTIGDTGARLRAKLYGFDGWRVRTVWERDNLLGGSISVSDGGDTVRLEYFNFPAEPGIAPPREIVEILHPRSTGLETY
jgi:hypothetical protein